MHHHHHQPISDWSLSCSFHPFVTVSLLFIRGTFPCWFLPQPSPYWYLPASWENILPEIFSLFHLKNWNIIGSPVWWDLSELSLTARLVLDSCLGPRPGQASPVTVDAARARHIAATRCHNALTAATGGNLGVPGYNAIPCTTCTLQGLGIPWYSLLLKVFY